MVHLDEFLSRIDLTQFVEVERVKGLFSDTVTHRYKHGYVTLEVFSTKMFINITSEHMVTYDPGMNHLIITLHANTGEDEVHKYKSISRYLSDEAFEFQQSLLCELPFSTESLKKLFELHERICNNIPIGIQNNARY